MTGLDRAMQRLRYPETTQARDAIRRRMPEVIEDARGCLRLAETNLDGPDPESALGYLAMAQFHIAKALERYDGTKRKK